LGDRLYRRGGLDDALFREETAKTVWNALNTPLAPEGVFSLGKLAKEDGIHELSFNYPLPRGKDLKIPEVKHSREGFLIGFIDLVFRHEDRYYIIDWKSNYLEDGYGPDAVKKNMDEADYHLQYKLYTIAVVRWLKAHIKDFDYGKHFGGVYYVYLRGRDGKSPEQGLFHYRPKDEAEIRDYERMLYKMVNSI